MIFVAVLKCNERLQLVHYIKLLQYRNVCKLLLHLLIELQIERLIRFVLIESLRHACFLSGYLYKIQEIIQRDKRFVLYFCLAYAEQQHLSYSGAVLRAFLICFLQISYCKYKMLRIALLRLASFYVRHAYVLLHTVETRFPVVFNFLKERREQSAYLRYNRLRYLWVLPYLALYLHKIVLAEQPWILLHDSEQLSLVRVVLAGGTIGLAVLDSLCGFPIYCIKLVYILFEYLLECFFCQILLHVHLLSGIVLVFCQCIYCILVQYHVVSRFDSICKCSYSQLTG